MPNDIPDTSLQLRSTVKPEGAIELTLARVPTPKPKADEVLVRIEAAPINPSDLGLLLAGAEPASFVARRHRGRTGRDCDRSARGAAR